MMKSCNLVADVAVGAALFAAASPAPADPAAPALAVSYRDLDVSSDAGAHILFRRITTAAESVCREQMLGQHGIDPARRYIGCRNAAIGQAVRAVGSERLSLYAARTPRRELPAHTPLAAR